MTLYSVPEEYYFRIHHIRPRFKGDIENVLIYMAEEIVAVGKQPTTIFVTKVNDAIFKYPGNAHRELKTINNWRTEISALFGFIEHEEGFDRPGRRAKELADCQDLVQSFKIWLFNFQYPGAHIKPKDTLEQVNAGIHFKPAQYILKLLKYANRKGGNGIGITKYEACHCVFNDLRVTRDNDDVSKTWARIEHNRKCGIVYDQTGDVVRYAGDVIDYMEIANLLKTYDGRTYHLNSLEEEAIIKFCESQEWFNGYDDLINSRTASIGDVKACVNDWFSYVNRDMKGTDFSTDILSYISSDEDELQFLRESAPQYGSSQDSVSLKSEAFQKRVDQIDSFSTKDIGDVGEGLVLAHECMRMKLCGRIDLIHLIKRIPTQLAIGYDISSIESDEKKRYIEVKTTISSKPLHFNKIHLTKNEWNTADSVRERYYVYRLLLSKNEKKLFLLQDPVGLYKKDLISMVPTNGADITFNPEKSGHFEELLAWKS